MVWLEAEESTPRMADADTSAGPVLRYAATLSTDFAYALPVMLTTRPASIAVAARVQTRPRTPLPSRDCSRVQPSRLSLIVLVVELVVRNSSNRSPGCTDCGIVTEWLGRFPAVVAEPTKLISPGDTASCGSTTRVV